MAVAVPIIVKVGAFLTEAGIFAFGTGAAAGVAAGVAAAASNVTACVASFASGVTLGGVGGYHLHKLSPEYRRLRGIQREYVQVIADQNTSEARRTRAITELLESAKNDPHALAAIQKILLEIDEVEMPRVECAVCYGVATHAFTECGHMCVCETCARQVMTRVGFGGEEKPAECPMCRATVSRVIRIFTE